YINNQLTKMDVCPVVIDGRTLAPTRYVAEAFGANVQWSQKNNMVVICSKDVYAYADYPDIPDLGRCYNIPLLNERTQNGYKVLSYTYSDMSNDDYYGYLYDNTALILGNYSEESIDYTDGVVTIAYTKAGEIMPRYFIGTSYDENGAMIFSVIIPNETGMENKVTLYALDGRTIEVLENEVPAYLNVGWYKSMQETQQTLYATDGRTVTVFKSEVPAYKNVGWYESQSEAQAANQTIYFNDSSDINNPEPDGYYYRTPTGKRYHLDPNCGGKNSYRTTNISGLSPCAKCAK
ncbi:MAG: copper amine oxidase N-terminal domain-containing protein, partial [Clostridia bacterium]|nr:copper amine oxidase N-terminal domain-containing protein [Clostridia bacterium]